MADIFDLFAKIGSSTPAKQAAVTHIVVGLGNPGDKYTLTRHNTGFLALDYISEKVGVKVDRARFKSLCGEGTVRDKRVLFMKPQTFMNLSGEAVREAAAFYKIAPENILVICDDINFDVGVFRVKRNGSDGGQNGMKNIIYQLASDKFPRIKIGVGKKPSPDYDLADFVLGKYGENDRKVLFSTFENVYTAFEKIIDGHIDDAMSMFNKVK